MIITPANTPITTPAIAPPEREEEESLSDVLVADVAAGARVGWDVGAAAASIEEEEEEEDVTDSGGDATTNGRVDVVVAVVDDMVEGKASMLCVWLLANENPMSISNEQQESCTRDRTHQETKQQ